MFLFQTEMTTPAQKKSEKLKVTPTKIEDKKTQNVDRAEKKAQQDVDKWLKKEDAQSYIPKQAFEKPSMDDLQVQIYSNSADKMKLLFKISNQLSELDVTSLSQISKQLSKIDSTQNAILETQKAILDELKKK